MLVPVLIVEKLASDFVDPLLLSVFLKHLLLPQLLLLNFLLHLLLLLLDTPEKEL